MEKKLNIGNFSEIKYSEKLQINGGEAITGAAIMVLLTNKNIAEN